MTSAEAKKLKPGGIVIWDNNPNDTGTVISATSTCITIQWKNGILGYVHPNDMTNIRSAGGN